MSSTIPDTVEQALGNAGLRSYASQARPVIDALVQRESQIATDLIGFARQAGMSEQQAADACREAGMHLPGIGTAASAAAQNAQAMPQDGNTDAVLARIEATLEDLSSFARQNGWRPSR